MSLGYILMVADLISEFLDEFLRITVKMKNQHICRNLSDVIWFPSVM